MKVYIQKVRYQKDTVLCPWVVSKNLQEGFIQIRNVLPVRSSFSVIFTFAILIVYIIKCASVVAVLVRRRHHLVIFFIFVVGHLELREVSTGRFGLSSSIYAICDVWWPRTATESSAHFFFFFLYYK